MSYNQYGGQGGYGQQQYGGNYGQQAPQQQQPPQQTSYYSMNGQPGGYIPPPPVQNYGGAPPQQGAYQAPPQSYGVPPPQQGFPQGYGAAPQQSYGQGQFPPQQGYAPPPPQPSHYQVGPPPTQNAAAYTSAPYNPAPAFPGQGFGGVGSQLFFLGVPIPAPPPAQPTQLPGYNPSFDSDRVRKATKGFGTDENGIINVLAPLDAFQVDALSRTYESLVGKTLQKTLEKELSGWLENGLVLTTLGPLKGDAHLLHRACAGAGTHEDLLTELLIHRTNQEIHLLKQTYQQVYGRDLTQVVKGELSMKTERMFMMALAGARDESPMINQQQVQQDVQAIYEASAGRMGTDEIRVCGILQQRSDAHLRAVSQLYASQHRRPLSAMVQSEFSGHMRDALLFLVKYFEVDGEGIDRDAEMLEQAMSGAGTKDERLIWRIVRGHWNTSRFERVKGHYQTKYRKSLVSRVKGETSGKYENMLVALIN